MKQLKDTSRFDWWKKQCEKKKKEKKDIANWNKTAFAGNTVKEILDKKE